IEVQDSIYLESSSYDFIISISQDPFIYKVSDSVSKNEYLEDKYKLALSKEKYLENKSKLEKYLKSKKYKFKHYNFNPELLGNKPYYFDNYLVTINSDFKTFKNLNNELEQFDFIIYGISNTNYKDEDKIEEMLFDKLIKNAKRKASMVAKMSDLKLGKIIQIDENTTSYVNKFGSWYHNNRWRVRSIIVKFSVE
ncbi:MAG TPA: SIMPL domain-containing protein, partial [Flavobacterium sp.]|nr:SIMPL domain-containing protein [Flavobacterium sp.]